MKSIMPFLLFILLLSCNNYHNSRLDNKAEAYSDSLSDLDIIFSLGSYPLKNYSDIDSILVPKVKPILDQVVFNKPSMRVRYSTNIWSLLSEEFFIKADNNKNFSFRELIFKINKATFKNLENKSHVFLEGLGYLRTDSDGVDVYELYLGS